MIKHPILIKREVEVSISVQAQRVLGQTNFSIEQFTDWILNKRKISFGGNNVIEFLDEMATKEEDDKSNGI